MTGRHRTHGALRAALVVWVILLAQASAAQPIRAGGIVGNGAPASCTEAALDAALAGGGLVTFRCGGARTIILTGQKTIAADTTIHGGGLITLSGGNSTRLFLVNASTTLSLDGLTISNGFASGDGGAIRNNGALVISNSSLLNNQTSATYSGGAIVSYGPMTITNSILANNRAGGGGAVYPRWSAARTTIINSVLHHNAAISVASGWGGALLSWDGPTVTLRGSYLYANSAKIGGAIFSTANSTLILDTNTVVASNLAEDRGGGIYNAGTATLTDASVSGSNQAYNHGGGIYNLGAATLTRVSLNLNQAFSHGGGLYTEKGVVSLTDVSITGGYAEQGAGVYGKAGVLTLTNVTISGNAADNVGGGILNSGAALALTNVTLSGNSANYGGGLFNSAGAATLTHVTLQGNSAPVGGGIYQASAVAGNVLTLLNTIVAGSGDGGNCFRAPAGVTTISSLGFNLSSDSTCSPYLNQGGDRNAVNPLLGPLADNGGATLTHLPQPGSPAIDGGRCAPGLITDQRGGERLAGGACDIGAVEVGAFLPWAFLPLARR